MNSEQHSKKELVDAIEAAGECDDPVAAAPMGDEAVLAPEFVERFLNMTRRTGRIQGVRCSIDQTEHYAFVLRGFRRGRWLLRARVKDWDREDDVTSGGIAENEVVYELDPVGFGTSGECLHRILRMNTAEQADKFFDDSFGVGAPIWEAIPLDGAESDRVTKV
ncbi:MAG: hypothetical protein U0638_12665 [Phycisphaerales bacterium]